MMKCAVMKHASLDTAWVLRCFNNQGNWLKAQGYIYQIQDLTRTMMTLTSVKLYPIVDPDILVKWNPTQHLLCFRVSALDSDDSQHFCRSQPRWLRNLFNLRFHRITDATLTSTMPWQMATLRHRGTVVSIKRCQPICEESLHARRQKKGWFYVDFYGRFWKICLIQMIMFSMNIRYIYICTHWYTHVFNMYVYNIRLLVVLVLQLKRS